MNKILCKLLIFKTKLFHFHSISPFINSSYQFLKDKESIHCQYNIFTNSWNTQEKEGRMTEFRLKSSSTGRLSHNVMSINSSNFKLSDLAPPVRMLRDTRAPLTESSQTSPIPPTGPSSSAQGKRRIQVVEHNEEDEEDKRLREEEKYPWLLEDSEDHSFVGRFEGGQTANYVFLVNEGDNFHIAPISKWYKFNPKPQYRTLSLAEAEHSLHSQRSQELSSSHLQQRLETIGEAAASSSQALKEIAPQRKLKVAYGNATSLDQNYYSKVYDENDLDFDVDKANFQDDEGDGLYDESEALEDSINEPHKHLLHQKAAEDKLTKYGKELKNIMKRTNDPNLHLYFAGLEENKDPYASDGDDAEDELLTPIDLQAAIAGREQQNIGDSGEFQPTKRPYSPSTQQSSQQAGRPVLISEAMVIEFLKRAPTTTKNLVVNFRQLIEQNPQNKETLTNILKKVAQIKETVEDGQAQKMLELRDEYKLLSGITNTD